VGNDVTVTATSISDDSKSASATFSITSNIVVTFSYAPPTSLNTNIEASLAAYTKGDPNNGGLNWSCTPASQCGSFGRSQTSNNQDTAYTAPLTVPVSNGGQVTVTATAVNDFNKSVSANITIQQQPPTLPDGSYVFQLNGQDNNGSAFDVAGAFTMQSGAIIGGEQDFTDAGDVVSDAIGRQGDISSTSIGVTTDGNLQIILDTGDPYIGPVVGGTPDGLETLNVALVDATTGSGAVTWFDSFAAGSGTLLPQDSTTAQTLPEYGYAFYAGGFDSGGSPVVMGGIINVDNPSGPGTMSGNGSAFDFSDASSTSESGQQLASTSTVAGPTGGTVPDAYGRVVFTLNPNASPSLPMLEFVGYIVDASAIALVETVDDFGGVTGGLALAQGQTKTGQFSTSDLSGSSYVVGAQGNNRLASLDFAGALSFNADTTVSGTADFNDSAFVSAQSTLAGNYSVDASGTGRATVSGLIGTYLNCLPNDTDTTCTPTAATLQLYLDGSGNALVVSMDANDFTAGPAYLESTSPSFTGSYAVGAVGFASTGNQWSAAGSVTIGSGGVIGSGSFTDFDYFAATLPASKCGAAGPTCPDLALTGTATESSGSIKGLGADSIATPPLTFDTFDFYVIDSLRAFGIESDKKQIGLLFLQQPPTLRMNAEQKRETTRGP
jgi:hypothetical protein